MTMVAPCVSNLGPDYSDYINEWKELSKPLTLHCISLMHFTLCNCITAIKDLLFWQLYFSPELQLLTLFYGMILE